MSEKTKKEPAVQMNRESSEITIKKKDLEILRRMIDGADDNLQSIKKLLFFGDYQQKSESLKSVDGKVVKGVFDGENMICANGKKFAVPANYASKSKLVPGDVLKLTILDDGGFIFKQIEPVERKKLIGEVNAKDDKYQVKAEGKNYNVLLASITYFKLVDGDKVTIIVPKDKESDWASIENVIGNV